MRGAELGPHPVNGPDENYVEPQPDRQEAHHPERQLNFFQRWIARTFNNNHPDVDRRIRENDEERLQPQLDEEAEHREERNDEIETIQEINNPQEAASLMATMTAAQWRERELRREYGPGIGGRWNAFMSGEFDFHVDEDGQIQKDGWDVLREIGRRTIRTVFNKQMMVTGALAATTAVFTGGIGIPAMAALIGAGAGRGLGEGLEALYDRRVETPGGNRYSLREDVARLQFQQHHRLIEMARAAQEEGLSDVEGNHRLNNLVNAINKPNNEIVERRKQMLQEEAEWNARRDVMAKIGAAAGLLGGLHFFGAELGKHVMTMDLDSDASHISHLVERVNSHWYYAYNNTAEAFADQVQGAHVYMDHPGGNLIHALGEPGWKVGMGIAKNVLPHLLQVGAVAGGLFLGRMVEKKGEADDMAKFERDAATREARFESNKKFLGEQVPGHEADFSNLETPQQRWEARFGQGKVPAPNQMWLISQPGERPRAYRINSVNLDNGQANVTELNQNMLLIADEGGHEIVQDVTLDQLADFGKTQQEASSLWLRQFGRGAQIDLRNAPLLNDEPQQFLDAQGQPIPLDVYQITPNAQDPSLVVLTRANLPDIFAPAFQFMYYGVNRINQERPGGAEARVEVLPAIVNHVWRIRPGQRENLPEHLRGLPDNFAITNVDERNGMINIARYNPRVEEDAAHPEIEAAEPNVDRSRAMYITAEEWPLIQGFLTETRDIAPAGGGGGNPRGGGGGNPRGGGGRGGERGGGGRGR